MAKHALWLPDGSVLSSGQTGLAAIRSVSVKQQVSSSQELMPGAVCAAMLELTAFAPAGFSVEAGQEVTLFRDGIPVGIFVAETPVRQSDYLYKLTGYDRVSCLDKELGSWLDMLTDWPYSLHTLADMVCTQCGTELVTAQIPNGSYQVQKFSAPGITGRQLMQWVAQASGCFCRANADGKLELGWYEDSGIHIGPSGEQFYYQGSLHREDYTVMAVEQVRLQQNVQDVGTVYPQVSDANTLAITGNYLLSATDAQALISVAQTLFERLQGESYTPCQLTVPSGVGIRAGQRFTVTDHLGVTFRALAMETVDTGFRCTVKCTGSLCRSSTSAVNQQSYQALSGKVLNLRTDVDGIKAENIDAAGRLARLELTVDGLGSTVRQQSAEGENLHTALTQLQQTAESLQLSVQTIKTQGADKVRTEAGYTFDADGLRISKEGEAMENRLDNTGMYVTRDGEQILGANHEGVCAINLTSRQFLIVGDNSRFENYDNGRDSKRTACFYYGG